MNPSNTSPVQHYGTLSSAAVPQEENSTDPLQGQLNQPFPIATAADTELRLNDEMVSFLRNATLHVQAVASNLQATNRIAEAHAIRRLTAKMFITALAISTGVCIADQFISEPNDSYRLYSNIAISLSLGLLVGGSLLWVYAHRMHQQALRSVENLPV